MVAPLECLEQVVVIDHRQSVARSVNALKEKPPVCVGTAKRVAEVVHFLGPDGFRGVEVRLNDAVVAARLIALVAHRECLCDVLATLARCYSNSVRVDVTIALDVRVERSEPCKGAHRNPDFTARGK